MRRAARLLLALAVAGSTLALAASVSAQPAAPIAIASTRSPTGHGKAGRAGTRAKPRTRTRAETKAAVRAQSLSPEQELDRELSQFWKGKPLRRGTTAVYVVDARSGDVLYAVHEDAPLNPASNVKLVATATALDVLGPSWRYHTRLYGPTPGADNVITGDVYLLGNYDPTLTEKHLTELATALARRGVTEIRGDLVVGTDRRDSLGRPRVTIEVKGTRPGQPPEVEVTPATELVEVEVTATTSRSRRARPTLHTEVRLVGDQQRCVFLVSGSAPRGRTRSYRRWVPERSLFTAHLLRAALEQAGVTVWGTVRRAEFADYVHDAVHGPAPYLPVELADHRSIPLGRLVTKINKRSINWLADAVLLTAGAVSYGGPPTMDKGVRAMTAWLDRQAGVAPGQVHLDTGSGLSYHSELSAHHIIDVLRAAAGYGKEPADDPAVRAFRGSLAVAGRDGTLRRRFRNTAVRGHMHGKTGTLTRIIALSGIISTGDDDALLFSIVTNGHRSGYRHRVRRQHELMVRAMFRYLERRKLVAGTR